MSINHANSFLKDGRSKLDVCLSEVIEKLLHLCMRVGLVCARSWLKRVVLSKTSILCTCRIMIALFACAPGLVQRGYSE